jgi:ABC-type glycerol-3-phosphate transport system substrate-binding protein
VFKDGDKTYGLPRNNYNMGLVYNRKLFTQAGLDPDAPPKTWSDVQAAAKKIAGLGAGYVGFGEYSAGNTGGWHFAASLYARGGSMVSDDGKTAAFNSGEGKAVLENLKQMRWNDNSMGSKQLLQWEDLMRMMGSGKLGMMIGAPDVVQSVNNDFQGKFEDYGVTAVPESEGKASLSGGDGYMFNPKATPEKIKAGLLWLEFHELTPGKGQFNYARSKEQGRPVGLPIPDLYGDSAPGQEIIALRKQYATVPVDHFAPYVAAQSNITNKLEPPKAQELYAVLDVAMSAVLTRKDADIDKLLSDAESKANKILAKNT